MRCVCVGREENTSDAFNSGIGRVIASTVGFTRVTSEHSAECCDTLPLDDFIYIVLKAAFIFIH